MLTLYSRCRALAPTLAAGAAVVLCGTRQTPVAARAAVVSGPLVLKRQLLASAGDEATRK